MNYHRTAAGGIGDLGYSAGYRNLDEVWIREHVVGGQGSLLCCLVCQECLVEIFVQKQIRLVVGRAVYPVDLHVIKGEQGCVFIYIEGEILQTVECRHKVGVVINFTEVQKESVAADYFVQTWQMLNFFSKLQWLGY